MCTYVFIYSCNLVSWFDGVILRHWFVFTCWFIYEGFSSVVAYRSRSCCRMKFLGAIMQSGGTIFAQGWNVRHLSGTLRAVPSEDWWLCRLVAAQPFLPRVGLYAVHPGADGCNDSVMMMMAYRDPGAVFHWSQSRVSDFSVPQLFRC